jgi:CubicO group peptidase (beta-lactamase class C family)
MKRLGFLAAAGGGISAAVMPATMTANAADSGTRAARTIPITGRPVPQLAAFDTAMVGFLTRFNVPGGQCAVAKDGRLVYARGFGYVNSAASVPEVSSTARFRIASSTKPMTAVAILRLVEDGAIRLDEYALDILHALTPPPGTTPDPRLRSITIRHLLEHSAGFVYPDAAGFDPQFDGLRLAALPFSHPFPATHTDIIRFALGRPLGFTPGTRYVYSNLGYNMLGRIIEAVTNLPYRQAVQRLIFDPIGVGNIAFMTRTSPDARLPDEVFYTDYDLTLPQYSIYDNDPFVRSYSYGGFDGAAIDAHGGAIANAPDLTRFLNAVAGSSGIQLLKPATVKTMLARPSVPGEETGRYYALGWNVQPGVSVMGHAGAITYGTLSVVIRLPGEITYAALFNHLDVDIGAMLTTIEGTLIEAAHSVRSWPATDLYPALV